MSVIELMYFILIQAMYFISNAVKDRPVPKRLPQELLPPSKRGSNQVFARYVVYSLISFYIAPNILDVKLLIA